MTTTYRIGLIVGLALFAAFGTSGPARASEVDELKATVQAMQKSMEQMQARIAELERENHTEKQHAATSRAAPPAPAEGTVASPPAGSAGGNQVVTIAPTAVTIEGRASEIRDRAAMDDQQEAAPRPNDLTLDPNIAASFPFQTPQS